MIGDASGQVRAVFFNQSFPGGRAGPPAARVALFGTVEQRPHGRRPAVHESRLRGAGRRRGRRGPARAHRPHRPDLRARGQRDAEDDAAHRARLPGGAARGRRRSAAAAEVRRRGGLLDRRTALLRAHFPESGTSIEGLNRYRTAAQRSLIFEEFFVFQLGLALKRRETDALRKPHRIAVDDRIRRAALDVLPFRLTGDQRRALREIVEDLQRPRPMNRPACRGTSVPARPSWRCWPRWWRWRTGCRPR